VQLLAEAAHGFDELRDDVRPLVDAAGPDAAQAWNIVSLLSSDASTVASSRSGCDEGCQQRKQHLDDRAKTFKGWPSTALEFFEGLEGDCSLRKQPGKRSDGIAAAPRSITTHGYVHAPEGQRPMMRVYQSSASQNQPFLATTAPWPSK